ncbi:hypothetical protein K493DRAFT_369794 [Basidiobolus meristosporus CBS 931.73]|uniref:F-box domain-containing protein n=1 Tax=Basidiobolus meristosporus CBS 931.73 TaxID=1314790 RepID=A0A1Y1YHA3_9FUNG|nr:hypothetical protein K493DRAFT_369794 [Basidiobolus meristosporus CBS 931.73]|eukprot:ORX97377.1 hypothetical protein K493DRAFT_369794 [Basidiobolus meristosporus CBS 931.73]
MESLNADTLERIFLFLDHPPWYAAVCRKFHQVALNPLVIANSYFNEYGVHGLWQVAKRHLPFLSYDIYQRLLSRGVQNDIWFYQIFVHEIVTSQIKRNHLHWKTLLWNDIGLILQEGLVKHGKQDLNRECLIPFQFLQPLHRVEEPGLEKVIDLLTNYCILPTRQSLLFLYSPCISSQFSLEQAIGRYMIHLITHESRVVEHMIEYQVYLDELDPYITYALLTNSYSQPEECYELLVKLRKIGLCISLSEQILLNVLVWFVNHDGLDKTLEFINQNWAESLANTNLAELAKQAIQEMFTSESGSWFPNSVDFLLSKIPESKKLFEDMMLGWCRRHKMQVVANATEKNFLEAFDELLSEKSPDAEMVGFFVSMSLWRDRSIPITRFFEITDPTLLQMFGEATENFLCGLQPTTFKADFAVNDRGRVRWLCRLLELWKADTFSTNLLCSYIPPTDDASRVPYTPSTPFHRQLTVILKASYIPELISKFENYLSPYMIKAWRDATGLSIE